MKGKWIGALILTNTFFFSNLGFSVSDFQLPWFNNPVDQTYDSNDYPDGIFLMEFTILNCATCATSHSFLNQLHDEHDDNDRVQLLLMGEDRNDNELQGYIYRFDIRFPILKSYGSGLRPALNVSRFPTILLFDCNFKELYRSVGSLSQQNKIEIRNIIDDQLATTCN